MKTELLESCDILLYKGTSFTSRLIRWGTTSEYSHVAIVVEPRMNLAIESNTGHQAGVRALDLRKLDDQTIDVFRVKEAHKIDNGLVISYVVGRLGSRFDWPGVIGLGMIKLVSATTGFKLFRGYNEFQKERDYFCSELVYEAFASAGLDIVPQISYAEITSPGDIARSPVVERILPAAVPEIEG